ncbi:SusC/RagA family TonB-linked outer membrane protein [Marinifilum sp. D737]|uniref:SusC/RagA family TonB-linked outer membrane protein n=1 Tax=Marinifilum sp. D737 TaxID=2969628 RepID=UPI002272E685|nr:TonB-dependent receptor [Marinifilum sp. D737]MCY1636547.1 TonB-dependent receptor [Marinifilum sp. D737]
MKKNLMWRCMSPTIRKTLLVMKLSFILILVGSLQLSASVLLGQQVSVQAKTSLVDVLEDLNNQTGTYFMYNVHEIDDEIEVQLDMENASLEEVLNEICKQAPVKYEIVEDFVIITKKDPVPVVKEVQEKKELKGKVTDKYGEPLPGVSVVIKGTSTGVATDIDGNYTLEMEDENAVLIFSFVGMLPQEVVYNGQKVENITLTSDTEQMEEVVVVGYGTTAVRDFTGSVARVSEKELEMKNVPSSISLLQNMAAGVMVSGNTGRPGETVRVRVRGATSLTGSNEPLYVIDGVPTDDAEILNSIPPSDIASVDVLKDASASAIYGSRAANGVLMITTKRGRLNEKAKFSVSYNYSTDSQIKNFSMLNGDEFRSFLTDLANQTLVVDPGNRTAENILDPDGGYVGDADTDWFDLVKQTANRQNVDLSVRGGSKDISYFISGSLMDHKGMVVHDDLTRYSGRVNLDIDINPKFKIGTRINLSYTDQSRSGTSMFSAQGHRPDLPVYGEDGVSYYDVNPVAESNEINNSDEYRLSGNLYGELTVLKDLKFKTSFSVNQYMNYNYQFSPSYLSWYNEASASKAESRGFNTVLDNTLSYAKTFNEVHDIDFVGGVSYEDSESQSGYLAKSGFAMDEIYTNVSAGTEFDRSSDSKRGRSLFSSFARLNYKYKDKYLFTVTARYDGSSMFGKNNRYGFFPSGAIAWRINKEEFLNDVDFINDLKLKVSAGKTGIQNLDSYSNRDLYRATKYNDQPGIEHSQIGNKDIQWELSTQYDAGLDFALFNYRLTGSIGYYRKDTEDLIREFSFPSSMAVNDMYYNIGSVRNQGFEFNIKAKLIDRKDFVLDLGLNLATNKNEIRKLEEEGAVENSSGTIVQGTGSQVLAVGHAMGSFFGYEYNGIIQNQDRIDELNANAVDNGHSSYYGTLYPGNLELTDLNGDGKVDSKDKTIIGNPDPDLFGGMYANMKYKRLSLTANFGFQIGGLKYYGKTLQNVPSQLAGLVDYNLYNRWSPENTDANIPAIYLGQGVPALTKMSLHDASYFRLQDLRISYDIPEIKGIPVSGQVYVSGTNVFTITSYPGTDPATVNAYGNFGGNYETSYPGIRTYSVGLKLNL